MSFSAVVLISAIFAFAVIESAPAPAVISAVPVTETLISSSPSPELIVTFEQTLSGTFTVSLPPSVFTVKFGNGLSLKLLSKSNLTFADLSAVLLNVKLL